MLLLFNTSIVLNKELFCCEGKIRLRQKRSIRRCFPPPPVGDASVTHAHGLAGVSIPGSPSKSTIFHIAASLLPKARLFSAMSRFQSSDNVTIRSFPLLRITQCESWLLAKRDRPSWECHLFDLGSKWQQFEPGSSLPLPNTPKP